MTRGAARSARAALAAGALAVAVLGFGLTPAVAATPEPTVTPPTATAPVAPGEPSPSPEGPIAPTPPATAAPTAVPVPTASPTPSPTEPAHLEGQLPAILEPGRTPLSAIIAVAVLVVSALLLRVRLAPRGSEPAPLPDALPAEPPTREATLAAMESVGEAMLDAGYSVTIVGTSLDDIARVNGFPSTEVVVFPTALFVSSRGRSDVITGAVASGRRELLFHQVDELDTVITAARTGRIVPATTVQRIDAMRELPPPYTRWQRVVAYVMLSGGLAVLLGASWAGTLVAGALGAVVGTILLLAERAQDRYEALITVGLSFFVATVVFTLTNVGLDAGVMPSLIAPLVTLLPGGLLTTGVIELSTGQMMAGAGRLAAGFMRLGLLAAGVVAAASLVGLPHLEFAQADVPVGLLAPLGAFGPWVAVAIFGVGIIVHQCGRRDSIGWILLVLYVAYGAQIIGDVFFGGVMSAFVGALVMTPIAVLVARHESGPAAFVTFLPAFWLLVPGSLGLMGVASILDGDLAGLNTLVVTVSTMVAIALGALAGSALSGPLRRSGHALL